MGETCGAVTGALMVIGLHYAKTTADDDGAREKAYDLVSEFAAKFRSRTGSLVCRELLGHDLSTSEGREAVEEQQLFAARCPAFVRHGAEILEELLA